VVAEAAVRFRIWTSSKAESGGGRARACRPIKQLKRIKKTACLIPFRPGPPLTVDPPTYGTAS
jgi:hypothetical protein